MCDQLSEELRKKKKDLHFLYETNVRKRALWWIVCLSEHAYFCVFSMYPNGYIYSVVISLEGILFVEMKYLVSIFYDRSITVWQSSSLHGERGISSSDRGWYSSEEATHYWHHHCVRESGGRSTTPCPVIGRSFHPITPLSETRKLAVIIPIQSSLTRSNAVSFVWNGILHRFHNIQLLWWRLRYIGLLSHQVPTSFWGVWRLCPR